MSVHVKSGQSFFIPFTNRIKTTGNLGGTAGDDSPVPMEAVTLPLGQGFFYSREQRAKRTCWHVHLATAARVKDPDACTGVFDYLRCDK